MARLTLTVSPEQNGRTVLSLLRGQLGLSTGCIGRIKRAEGGLICNGQRVFTNHILQSGDVLTVDLSAGETPTNIPPVPMDLDIAFEDEHLLVINKRAPLAVIPSSLVPTEPTLAAGLMAHLGPSASLHPVNRLDRGTTGLMVVAKNGYIHDQLRRHLHSGSFFRSYLAVCIGSPKPSCGTISLSIGRAPGSAIRRQIDPAGQWARTDYRLLRLKNGLSLVAVTPHTGRTHQIRVHMAAIGCPLAGDWLYGTEDHSLIPRPALHAVRLAFTHPLTGDNLSFTAPLPADMKLLLER